MDFDQFYAKTPATLDEIRGRVAYALERHPLCRNVEFDIVSMPRTRKTNWTISLHRWRRTRCGRRPISSPTSRKPMIWRLRPDFWPFRCDFRVFPRYCPIGGMVKP